MRIEGSGARPLIWTAPVQSSAQPESAEAFEVSSSGLRDAALSAPQVEQAESKAQDSYRHEGAQAAEILLSHVNGNCELTAKLDATYSYVVHAATGISLGSIIPREQFLENLRYFRDVMKNAQEAASNSLSEHQREDLVRQQLAAFFVADFRNNIQAARGYVDKSLDEGLKIASGGLDCGTGTGGQRDRNQDQRGEQDSIPGGTILLKGREGEKR